MEFLKGSITANKKNFFIAVLIIVIAIIAFSIFLVVFKKGASEYLQTKEIIQRKQMKNVNKISNEKTENNSKTTENNTSDNGIDEETQKLLNEKFKNE